MTDDEPRDFQAELENILDDLRMLWVDAMHDLGGGSQTSQLIAKALNDLRDAARCAANPALHQERCITVGGKTHAVNMAGVTLCGVLPNLIDSALSAVTVPTCEDCIRILTEKEGA